MMLRRKCELIEMEKTKLCFSRLTNLTNKMEVNGEFVLDKVIISKKVCNTLLMNFDSLVTVFKKTRDLE